MDIASLASRLNEIELELMDLELDMIVDEEEKNNKENIRRELLNSLLFFDEHEELYTNNEKFEIDSKLLYPFKEIIDENGNKAFIRKDSEEYREDVYKYIEDLTTAYNDGRIDEATFNKMKEEAEELANKQMEKIEEEEKEQEEEMDIGLEHEKLLNDIEETKESFILHEIGEESYSSLCYKYKNMQEIERKELLYRTHTGLCNEMGITCNIDFTKYDFDDDKTVNKDSYYIKNQDINGVPFPLDTILLEQTFKLYISNINRSNEYTPRQKEELTKLLYKDLSVKKDLILDRIKKKRIKALWMLIYL